MSGSYNHRSNNPQQIYTSFDQFIAQNDFSQLNNHNNNTSQQQSSQYYYGNSGNTSSSQSYYPPQLPSNGQYSNNHLYNTSHTLTADATEFVPQQQFSQYYANFTTPVNPVPSKAPLSLAQLTLTENGNSQGGTSASHSTLESSSSSGTANTTSTSTAAPPPSASTTGAIPKQSARNRNNHQQQQQSQEKAPQNPSNRRQSAKNPKPVRRKYDQGGDEYYWNSNDREVHQEGLSNGHNSHFRQNNHSQPKSSDHRNRSNRNGGGGHETSLSSSSSAVAPQFRNHNQNMNHNNQHRGGSEKRQQQQQNQPEVKRKPVTDYQPNRNLKRPERVLDMPVDISQREKQIVEIDAGHLECLVCVERIKPFQSTWNCKNCYSILHLSCTNKWATRSKSEQGWRCPACQNFTPDVPNEYFCFCGKQKNPQYNRSDVAHSCGEVCHRKVACVHPCTLLCHPGACPTCQASVTRQCGCGGTSKTMICCQEEAITCEGHCDKLRNCGLHRCGQRCHVGECEPCGEQLEHECHCGRTQRKVDCTAENLAEMKFACESSCEKELNCGNHKCQRLCHSDECRECELTPDRIRACPCGKKPILAGERKTCLDEIPLCESVCNKILSCGAPSSPHRCIAKCHLGACPPCQKSTAVKCRCGQMDQMVM